MQVVNFSELDERKAVAVAVSGGADSMALAHMLSAYAKKRKGGFTVLALTVDHGLRRGSAAEAAEVAKRLAKLPHVTHRTLRWTGKKPATRIMERARTARYELMAAACKKAGIDMLALAHHADDSAETFFMRLAHGSGLDGLAGMKRVSVCDERLFLYRPLLDVSHADLVGLCRKARVKWVEDPTNENDRFARSRLRKVLSEEGLDAKRLGATLRRLAAASDALAAAARDAAKNACIEGSVHAVVYDFKKMASVHPEIFLRVLRAALERYGKGGYGPRLEKLEEIAPRLKSAKTCTRVTLGGCLIEAHPRKNTLKIIRE